MVEEGLKMAEYISKEFMLKNLEADKMNNADHCEPVTVQIMERFIRYVKEFPAADVQPVDRWISVKDRLPDTLNDCLVWYSCDTAFGKSKCVGISFCLRGDWYTKKLDGENIVVLYWQYLPDYSKDGDTDA